MMKKDWSHYRLVAILPLLGVVILYAAFVSARYFYFHCNNGGCESIPANIWKIFSVNSNSTDPPPTDPNEIAKQKVAKETKDREATALKYSGRMTWYFLAMIYLFICIGALAVASIITLQLSTRRSLYWMLPVIVMSLLVGLYLYLNPYLHMPMFMAVFEKTITDVPAITQITNFLDSLGNAAAFSLLLTSCAILFPVNMDPFPVGMKELSRRMKYLRLVLYAGTLLLVSTVILKKSIFQWSIAYTSQDPQATKAAGSFVSNFLTVEGGFYTLVLFAVYVPAAFVLQRRASRLGSLPADDSEKEKKFQEYGLTFSFKESVPKVLAILGPILVGPIGEFLNRSF